MPSFEVNNNGVISVDTTQLQADIQQSYLNTFGNTLNLDASTPQGQLCNNDIETIKSCQDDLLKTANSFNIYTAEGGELDTAAAFFGYTRKTDVATVVQATLTGTENTVIDSGSLVSDGTYEYKLLSTAIIGSNGTAMGTFQCTTSGVIVCLAGSLNTIVSTKTGWDSVNNTIDGITGYDSENDNIFKQRITANWLNIRAKGLLGAIIDNIAQLDNVIDVVGNENNKSISQTIDNISMLPHSIYLSILGGNDSDIAKSLLKIKTLGTVMNGDNIISYYDDATQHSFNYNIYRPTLTNIQAQVNFSRNTNTPENIKTLIKNTLYNYLQQNQLKIGETVSSIYLSNAFDNFKFANILSVKVNLAGEQNYLDYITMSVLQVAVLSLNNIDVVEV